MSPTVEPLIFTVPLSFEAHRIAQRYQKWQSIPFKAKQVYLNTLAVYAVDFYLRCLGFEADVSLSDSRNPMIATMMDVADLWVKQLGRLECRPVLTDDQVMQIPPDVESDRMGYIAVHISQNLKEATLLGFAQTVDREVPLSQLRSLSEFPAYLHRLQQASVTTTSSSTDSIINLKNWLEGIFDAGWQTIEAVLDSDKLDLVSVRSMTALKTETRRAKLIDFGMQLGDQSVALSLGLNSNVDGTIGVLVQLFPGSGSPRLTSRLKLIMLSESGETLQEVCARSHDNYIQLRSFKGLPGDCFSIQVACDNVRVTEDFVL
ncbi:MAG: DUF1822 family protein [Leptolyngbyaceae cyanobacterium SU_3_3]|nr:DUF1822 family protein [Leptolyngbyaceae cyanobacterium SU_3_3]NJR49449.1 DUF1822 family protein [Leptolyngbyaceae cyanobacterium CSU_1_3]